MAGQLWDGVFFTGLMPDERGLQLDVEQIADDGKLVFYRLDLLPGLLIGDRSDTSAHVFELTAQFGQVSGAHVAATAFEAVSHFTQQLALHRRSDREAGIIRQPVQVPDTLLRILDEHVQQRRIFPFHDIAQRFENAQIHVIFQHLFAP
jgi:hypothetical protein